VEAADHTEVELGEHHNSAVVVVDPILVVEVEVD
jgi:hypothetical protein